MLKYFSIFFLGLSLVACAEKQDVNLKATYLGNEGVMVESGANKILFDPLFATGFDQYQIVPDEILKPLIAGQGAFENVDYIFVSHMHPDHFATRPVIQFLRNNPKTEIYAHRQVIDLLESHAKDDPKLRQRFHALDLGQGETQQINLKNMSIDAMHTPHSGGDRHAHVANIIFRIRMKKDTVMHFGDATTSQSFYAPHRDFLQAHETDLAMPPYWLFAWDGNVETFKKIFNAQHAIGTHVPIHAPAALDEMDIPYFHQPGEIWEKPQLRQP